MTQTGELTRDSVESAVRYADTWLAYQQTYQRIPGVQAAVLHDVDVVLTTAHGQADVERDLRADPRPPVSGGLALQDVHRHRDHAACRRRGRSRLDDAAGKWLTWLESPVSELTLREMLAHSSGIFRDSLDSDFWQLMRPFPDEAALRDDRAVGCGRPPAERAVQVLEHHVLVAGTGDSRRFRAGVQRLRHHQHRRSAWPRQHRTRAGPDSVRASTPSATAR